MLFRSLTLNGTGENEKRLLARLQAPRQESQRPLVKVSLGMILTILDMLPSALVRSFFFSPASAAKQIHPSDTKQGRSAFKKPRGLLYFSPESIR